MSDTLNRRGHAMVELFFANHNAELTAAMKAEASKEHSISELAQQTGISDEELLSTMVDLGLQGSTLAAFRIVPLLIVAWSDGMLDNKEREGILLEATTMGVKKGSDSYALLESWLTLEPNTELVSAYGQYIEVLLGTLTAAQRTTLREDILTHAKRIARVSGGFLGLSAMTDAEKAALKELERILG